ncbi:MAG: four helix bundle protein [Phycisphaerae bacterium]
MSKSINSYKDLVAWQKSMSVVEHVYALTAGYPPGERYGLVAQIRRAAVSIPSNVAEGYGRRTRADYVRFLDMDRGSANELETQLLIAGKLGFGCDGHYAQIIAEVNEVQRILRGLVDSIEAGKLPAAPGRH